MKLKDNLPYFEDSSVRMVGLPYDGENVHMFIVLPSKRFGLANVEKSLTGQKLLDSIGNRIVTKVQVNRKHCY